MAYGYRVSRYRPRSSYRYPIIKRRNYRTRYNRPRRTLRFRRRFTRYTPTNPFGGVLNRLGYKKGNPWGLEKKLYDEHIPLTTMLDNGTYVEPLCFITQGTALNQRVGQAVTAKTLHVSLYLKNVRGNYTDPLSVMRHVWPNCIRAGIVIQKQGVIVASDTSTWAKPSDIWDTQATYDASLPAIIAKRNANHTEDFVVLKDVQYKFDPIDLANRLQTSVPDGSTPPVTTYTTAQTLNPQMNYFKFIDWHIPLKDLEIKYDAATPGAAAMLNNIPYIFFMTPFATDDNRDTHNSSLQFGAMIRTRYYDC